MNPLTLSRQCAYIMRQISDEIGLGSQAERFSSEDRNLWIVVDASEVRLVKYNQLVATFHLGETAEVIIPDVYGLISGSHQSEFVPEDYGVLPRPPPSILEIQEPQLHFELIEIPNPSKLRQGPRQYIPESTFHRKPKSKRQYEPKG